jgi:hypothetical protein
LTLKNEATCAVGGIAGIAATRRRARAWHDPGAAVSSREDRSECEMVAPMARADQAQAARSAIFARWNARLTLLASCPRTAGTPRSGCSQTALRQAGLCQNA